MKRLEKKQEPAYLKLMIWIWLEVLSFFRFEFTPELGKSGHIPRFTSNCKNYIDYHESAMVKKHGIIMKKAQRHGFAMVLYSNTMVLLCSRYA